MSQILAVSAVVSSAALLVPGCGPGAPTFDSKVNYTAESLAQEFLFRYKEIGSPPARDAPKSAPPPDRKAKEETKKAPVTTLAGLLEDIAAKVHLIREGTPDENCKKVSDAISGEPTISAGDKALIAEKLRELVKARE